MEVAREPEPDVGMALYQVHETLGTITVIEPGTPVLDVQLLQHLQAHTHAHAHTHTHAQATRREVERATPTASADTHTHTHLGAAVGCNVRQACSA